MLNNQPSLFHDLQEQSLSEPVHLGAKTRVNLGSFYTPARYVDAVGEWLVKHGVGDGWTIADLSCGYGAFFRLAADPRLAKCRYVGNDIDALALEKAADVFPFVAFSRQNALVGVEREKFGIGKGEKLVVVGNPPYNDITSQAKQKIKAEIMPIDVDLKARDVGMSSLLAYERLRADFVAVLHPLSYLVKKSNFDACRRFFGNYEMLENLVFPSSEFAGTSRKSVFPVVVGLYKRKEGVGMSFDDAARTVFKTVEGDSFSLSQYEFITAKIAKYPTRRRYKPELLFYTIRDINALKRSKTFLPRRIPNAVDVDPARLAYYCYIDAFKRYARTPYWMGNLDIPYDPEAFARSRDDMLDVAMYNNPAVFGRRDLPSPESFERVRTAIAGCLPQFN